MLTTDDVVQTHQTNEDAPPEVPHLALCLAAPKKSITLVSVLTHMGDGAEAFMTFIFVVMSITGVF